MARVLRPGGRAALGNWDGLTAPMRVPATAVARAAPDHAPLSMPPGIAALGSLKGMAAAFADAGLTDARVEDLTLPTPPLQGRGRGWGLSTGDPR